MTVRNINTERIREGQRAWLEAEFDARAAFADVRLDSLERLASEITYADRFDAAYAIWDDYIDGRRADERFEPLAPFRLMEQASIFARISRYLPCQELHGLASAAWGADTFEVFTRRQENGRITGKLGWYRGDTLLIVRATDGPVAQEAEALTIWKRGWIVFAQLRPLGGRRIALHPAFGRVGS